MTHSVGSRSWDSMDETEELANSPSLELLEKFRELNLLSPSDKPRLNPAKVYFSKDKNQDDLPLLESLYVYWRESKEFITLRTQQTNPRTKASQWKYIAVKCSKRGNDVYNGRVKKRLNWLDREKDVQFFEISDFYDDKALGKEKDVFTSALWITLTYDTKRCSRAESWENIGIEWNRCISALRRKYGKISAIRTFEATERGYSHIHAICLFADSKFHVEPHLAEDDNGIEKLSFRVSKEERAQLRSYWHSNIDVQAIGSTKKLFNYMRKYQTKTLLASDSPKGVTTNALMWIYGKRSFSVSGDFREALHDLIRLLHNSNKGERQQLLDGSLAPASVWEFCGIFTGQELGIKGNRWTFQLNPAQIEFILRRESENKVWN